MVTTFEIVRILIFPFARRGIRWYLCILRRSRIDPLNATLILSFRLLFLNLKFFFGVAIAFIFHRMGLIIFWKSLVRWIRICLYNHNFGLLWVSNNICVGHWCYRGLWLRHLQSLWWLLLLSFNLIFIFNHFLVRRLVKSSESARVAVVNFILRITPFTHRK